MVAAATINSTAEPPVQQKRCLRLLLRVEKAKSLNRCTLVLQCRVEDGNDEQFLPLRPGTRCLLHVVEGKNTTMISSSLRNRLPSQALTSRWIPLNDKPLDVIGLIEAIGIHSRNRRGDVMIAANSIRSLAAAGDTMKKPSVLNTSTLDDATEDDDIAHTTDFSMIHTKQERHGVFAHWLVHQYGRAFLSTGSGVLDVAGGNGQLSGSLLDQYGIPCHLLDPNPRITVSESEQDDSQKIHILPFALQTDGSDLTDNSSAASSAILNCSIVVGMHPDQATEPIVDLALRLGKPFAIVPCCVMPKLFPHRRQQPHGDPVRSYSAFCQYLLDKVATYHPKDEDRTCCCCANQDVLPFWGRNKVLFTKARNDDPTS